MGDQKEDLIVLQPVLVKPYTMGDKLLDRIEVESAPNYVCKFIFDGDQIPGEKAGEILAALITNGHSFTVLEPKREEISLQEFAWKWASRTTIEDLSEEQQRRVRDLMEQLEEVSGA